jgi:hypothetical protein
MIELTEAERLQEIRRRFPREYVAKLAHMEIIATRDAFARRPRKPLKEEDLICKNLFLWGDPGTGKTYWGHALCGEFPILKGQNKWWDGTFSEVPPTGILWNDAQPLSVFNWQTPLDSADRYGFIAEIKFGCRLIDPRMIYVVCTSNYSPDEPLAGMPEVRIQELKRRFRLIEMRWAGTQRERILRIIYHGPATSPRPGTRNRRN